MAIVVLDFLWTTVETRFRASTRVIAELPNFALANLEHFKTHNLQNLKTLLEFERKSRIYNEFTTDLQFANRRAFRLVQKHREIYNC